MSRDEALRAGLVVMLLVFGLILAAPICLSCTPAARSEADVIAVDLTRAVCSPADPLDQNPIVEVVCLVAEAGEAFLSAAMAVPEAAPDAVATDAGVVAAVPKSITLRMRREHVGPFVARHRKRGHDAALDVGAEP